MQAMYPVAKDLELLWLSQSYTQDWGTKTLAFHQL